MAALIRGIRDSVDWRIITTARTGLGLAAAIGLLRACDAPFPWRPPRALWIRSGCGAIAFLCTFYATSNLPVADALVLLNTSPIWLVALSAFLFRQRLRPFAVVSLVIATAGIIILAQPHFAQRNLGALAGMATGFLTAASLLAIGRLRSVHHVAIVAHSTAAAFLASVLVLVCSATAIDFAFARSARTMAILAVIAALGTVAQVQITRAFSGPGATRIAPLQYSTVAFGALLDYLLYGQHIGPTTAFGIVLIVGPALCLMLGKSAIGDVHSRALSIAADAWMLSPSSAGAGLARLEDAIRAAEKRTSCEVRVHVDRHCADAQRTPAGVFATLGMTRTRQRNGVLVYLALESRVFSIIVDEGISERVSARSIAELCDTIIADMRARDPVAAVADGIITMFDMLGASFPYQTDDVNELPDEISLGVGM
jgi:drug/metabolite transporter (DMT)-like permease